MISSPILKNTTVAYKVVNIEVLDMENIEKRLALVMMNVTYYTRGSNYATVEVHFSSSENVQEFSDKTFNTGGGTSSVLHGATHVVY